MNIDRLVTMANDIGAFFDSEPDKAEAARGVAGHIQRFWAPAMRVQIIAHEQAGGAGMLEVVRAGIRLLPAVPDAAVRGDRPAGGA